MLWLVGIGIWEPKDMSIKAYDVLKRMDEVYLEDYTAHTYINANTLSEYLGRDVVALSREKVEDFNWILKRAKQNHIALAIKGDVFAATTHYEIYKTAKIEGIDVKVIHGSSVFSAIGKVGLSLYKFGRTVSLPHPRLFPSYPFSPFEMIKQNLNLGMHTLVLLDIKMHIVQGIKLLDEHFSLKLIGCYALGSEEEQIAYGTAHQLINYFEESEEYASCIVVPGTLEFYESDALKLIELKD